MEIAEAITPSRTRPGREADSRDNGSSHTAAVLVAHTHWDREWYLTVEQLRPRLVRLFANLRQILQDEPDYRCFWLDGQTCCLHDYWDAVGHRPRWLDEALRARKILIGPWYTLVDEWLVGGESIIRNLFEGRRTMRAVGQDNRIGYLPDSFGHISQMPSILTGFGIDNAFLFRGLREEALPSVEVEWISAQGESMHGTQLLGGYSNAQRIDAERHLSGEPAAQLVKNVEQLKERSATDVLLLMNGVDQALPTHHLSHSVAKLRDLLPGLRVEQGSLADYLALVKGRLPAQEPLPVFHGELTHAPELDGALSARVEQKIANRAVENLLAYSVEPLLTLVHPERRSRYRGILQRAWRLAMQCHGHDSICSCHSDLVAADLMNRLGQAQQLAESLEQELLVDVLGVRPAEQSAQLPSTLVLRNPLPWQRVEPVEVTLDVPAEADPDSLVFEQEGEAIPAQVISRQEICRWTEHYYGKVENKEAGTQRLTVLLQPRLGAGGFEKVAVRSGDSQQLGSRMSLWRQPDILDNGLIHVVVHRDGTMDITDLATGFQMKGLNRVVDETDRGDLYEHARELSPALQSPQPGSIQRIEDSELRAALLVTCQIECNGITCPLRFRIDLDAGSRWVSVQATLDNRSQDHWVRMACPVPDAPRELLAHTPFDLVQRHVEDGAPYREGDRLRFGERLGQSMQWGLFARGDRGILGIFNRGLYEYTHEESTLLSISLMRFVGLIRPDLTSYPATGANRPGLQRVDYALGLWPPDRMSDALRAMVKYNVPPRCVQTFGESPALPAVGLRLSNPYWMPSAFKSAEEGDGVVLRFWNASDVEQEGVVEFSQGLEGAMLARLDETPLTPLPSRITTGPKEIVTILIPRRGAP